MDTPTAVHIFCQSCKKAHSPQRIKENQGACESCSGEVWALGLSYIEKSIKRTGIPLVIQIHSKTTATTRFTYLDIPKDIILFLISDNALIYERAASYGALRSQQDRLERGAQYCRVCGALYENLVPQPWFELGCCSKSCGARAKVSEEAQPDAIKTAPAAITRSPIPVSCSKGHQFEAPYTLAGCKRACPECGEKCQVPESVPTDLEIDRKERPLFFGM